MEKALLNNSSIKEPFSINLSNNIVKTNAHKKHSNLLHCQS